MAASRPGYLEHLVLRPVDAGRARAGEAMVLLRPGVTPDAEDMLLGRVVPHPGGGLSRRARRTTASWGFVCEGAEGSSGSYRSRREAAESCAVEVMDGPGARRRFDAERWERRRPTDN